MPSFLQPSDSIGHTSSFEEEDSPSSRSASTSNHSLRTIDHATLNQERMERTNNVREKLGPLIKRLKDSVKSIQSLENSMQISTDGADDCNKGDKGSNTSFRPGESRILMQQSMQMVKEKMFRLKTMEEELVASEDRYLQLHHHFQQQLSLQPIEASLKVPKEEFEYQNRIADLEEEVCFLKEQSALVHHLKIQNKRLSEKAKNVEELKRDLRVEKSLRQKLESKLFGQECKINEQAVKYDGLSTKFEALTTTFAHLTKTLEAQEHEIIDTMTLHKMYLANTMGPPATIEHSDTNESTALTEPMTSLSWTESSISNDDASFLGSDHSNAAEDSLSCIEDSTSTSTVQVLKAKVDALNRENASLRKSKNHALDKYKSLRKEMKTQSSMIESLRQKLDHGI